MDAISPTQELVWIKQLLQFKSFGFSLTNHDPYLAAFVKSSKNQFGFHPPGATQIQFSKDTI